MASTCVTSAPTERAAIEAPLLPFGAEAPGRGVEHNAFVGVAAALFTLGKFEGVFHHPSNAVEAAQFHIDAGPIHHLSDGIYMRHLSTHRSGGDRSATGVGEEVQKFVTGLEVFSDVFPIGRLFGENADVLEPGHFKVKTQLKAW